MWAEKFISFSLSFSLSLALTHYKSFWLRQFFESLFELLTPLFVAGGGQLWSYDTQSL